MKQLERILAVMIAFIGFLCLIFTFFFHFYSYETKIYISLKILYSYGNCEITPNIYNGKCENFYCPFRISICDGHRHAYESVERHYESNFYSMVVYGLIIAFFIVTICIKNTSNLFLKIGIYALTLLLLASSIAAMATLWVSFRVLFDDFRKLSNDNYPAKIGASFVFTLISALISCFMFLWFLANGIRLHRNRNVNNVELNQRFTY